MTLEDDTPLPWVKGHRDYLESKEGDEWRHTVYIGIADMEKLAKLVIQEICPKGNLTKKDSQQLNGKGYMALFCVNGQGLIDSESYVPASFVLGLAQYQTDRHLFDIKKALREADDKFKERRKGQVITPAAPENKQSTECQSVIASRKDIEAELMALLQPLNAVSGQIKFKTLIKSKRKERDVDFLNSFYLEDLDNLIIEAQSHNLGAPLAAYLGLPSDRRMRQDVLVQHEAMAGCVTASALPLGRWPSKKSHHLKLAQQAAVNQICALNNSSGLIAVNGPPGTGKTTLLQDVVADVVVKRAQALAALTNSWTAFEGKAPVGGMDFYRLKPDIVGGTGIVVSSNNNAAVENITKELPSLLKIATDDYPDAAYFQDVARQVCAAANIPGDVWGMVAAALGNRDNRRKFMDAFYPYQAAEYKQGTPCDMQSILKAQGGTAKDAGEVAWRVAKNDFTNLLGRVKKLKEEFERIEKLCRQVRRIEADIAEDRRKLLELPSKLASITARYADIVLRAEHEQTEAARDLKEVAIKERAVCLKLDAALNRLKIAEHDASPNLLERLLGMLGIPTQESRARDSLVRKERQHCSKLQEASSQAISERHDAVNHAELCEKKHTSLRREGDAEIAGAHKEIAKCQKRVLAAEQALQRCTSEIEVLRKSGYKIPDQEFFSQSAEKRHLSSVWVTEEFDELRAKLFLAALRLHEATLLSCNWKAMKNLAAVRAMLNQSTPNPLSEFERGVIWDMLFFVVPVVSTTLASFDRLFVGMGRESLGWLLIDEAGQATPQSVAGALWRSRRAVIIGDPFQVEPVMTVPAAVVAELEHRSKVGPEWSPSSQSAQTLADRTMRLGAYVGDGPDPTWTGLPLRAHGRCIDPMFSVSNAIAYEGQMVQANTHPESIECSLGESAWFDVKGGSAEGQVVKEEIDVLVGVQDLEADLDVTLGPLGRHHLRGPHAVPDLVRLAVDRGPRSAFLGHDLDLRRHRLRRHRGRERQHRQH